MAEAYSDDLGEMCSWEFRLNCAVIQFSTPEDILTQKKSIM